MRARVDGTPLCATAFVRMRAEVRASRLAGENGPGLYGNGRREKKGKKKRKKKKAREVGEALDIRGCFILPFFFFSLSSLLPVRATATSWQTGRCVPDRSVALTSPFLPNLICRERRCHRRASPTFHLASNYPTPVSLRIPAQIFQIFSRYIR